MGLDSFHVFTNDRTLSSDKHAPTRFDFEKSYVLTRGMTLPGMLGIPAVSLPFDVRVTVQFVASGSVDGSHLVGAFDAVYVFHIGADSRSVPRDTSTSSSSPTMPRANDPIVDRTFR